MSDHQLNEMIEAQIMRRAAVARFTYATGRTASQATVILAA